MYPFLRLAKTVLMAKRREPISYRQKSNIQFRCHPWDIDLFNEMNNGRALTLYDLGRIDLAVRMNLDKLLLKNKWALVVAGSSVRYRKRVRMFDKIEMRTQCVGMDSRWIYLEQSMWVKGQPCSSVLIRGGISSQEGLIPTIDLLTALEELPDTRPLPTWVVEWINSEQHRPWPPSSESTSKMTLTCN